MRRYDLSAGRDAAALRPARRLTPRRGARRGGFAAKERKERKGTKTDADFFTGLTEGDAFDLGDWVADGLRASYDGVQGTARPTKFGLRGGFGLTDLWGLEASYLGLRSSDSLQPRLSNYGPSALSVNLTKVACEGNEVLSGRFCRRAGRTGSTSGETPDSMMGAGGRSKNVAGSLNSFGKRVSIRHF